MEALKRITKQLQEQNARVKAAEEAARQHFATIYPDVPAPYVNKWLRRTGHSPSAVHYAHKLFGLRNQLNQQKAKREHAECLEEYATATLEEVDTDMRLLQEFNDAYARAKYLRDAKKRLRDELSESSTSLQ
jgi:hypothetical protein